MTYMSSYVPDDGETGLGIAPALIGAGVGLISSLFGNAHPKDKIRFQRNVWLYSSSNLSTDLTAAGFFSDAQALGMRFGDIVIGTQFDAATSGSSQVAFMGALGALTTAGAAALTTGTLMTSTRATSL